MNKQIYPFIKPVFEPTYTPMGEKSDLVIPVDHTPVLSNIILKTKDGDFLEIPFLNNQTKLVGDRPTAIISHLVEAQYVTLNVMLNYVVDHNEQGGFLVMHKDFDEPDLYVMCPDRDSGLGLDAEGKKTLESFLNEITLSEVVGYNLEVRRDLFSNPPIEI